MNPTYELKPLSPQAIPAALEKAHRYRLLNEALEAESICRDILSADPANQEALVTLVLALTDQFVERPNPCLDQARQLIPQIADEHGRHYYAGIICERRAKAQLKRGGMHAGHIAHDWFKEAMGHFEKAAEVRPAGNDGAILRWNTCARILMANPRLVPAPDEVTHSWLE
jgi:hypothetical protein